MNMNPQPVFDPYYEWLGISPAEQPPNFYRLLGIRPFEQNPHVIHSAAEQQLVFVQQFQHGPRGQFVLPMSNLIAHARGCLLDPQTKAAYDAEFMHANARVVQPVPVSHSVPMAKPVPVAATRVTFENSWPNMAEESQHAVVLERKHKRPKKQQPMVQMGMIAFAGVAGVICALIILQLLWGGSSKRGDNAKTPAVLAVEDQHKTAESLAHNANAKLPEPTRSPMVDPADQVATPDESGPGYLTDLRKAPSVTNIEDRRKLLKKVLTESSEVADLENTWNALVLLKESKRAPSMLLNDLKENVSNDPLAPQGVIACRLAARLAGLLREENDQTNALLAMSHAVILARASKSIDLLREVTLQAAVVRDGELPALGP